jgi:hypothetical protein
VTLILVASTLSFSAGFLGACLGVLWLRAHPKAPRLTNEELAAMEISVGMREMTDAECDAILVPRIKYTQRGMITPDQRDMIRRERSPR